MSATRFVVLLRAANVGGRPLPMAALRAALAEAGLPGCETYIQSGNLLIDAAPDAAKLEQLVEQTILDHFGLAAPAIARTAAAFEAMVATDPFPDAAAKPLHLCLSKRPLVPDVAHRLMERAAAEERVTVAGDALWIDYASGVGRSKLTPAALDKAVGSIVTARNLNTVQKLVELAAR